MSMEGEVVQLKKQLSGMEEQLMTAGRLGSQLLERNGELSDDLERRNKEHATEIENLEQEKYSLQLRVEQKTFSERTYQEEAESLRETLRRERQEHELRLETINQSELSTLKAQLGAARSDCEKAQLSEKQLRERHTELEQLLEEAQERVRQKVTQLNETTSEEMAALHSEIIGLQNDKLSLMKELGDLKDQTEMLRLQLESATHQLSAQTQEVEQQQCQITSYFNALEKAREEGKELRAEIDVLRMESQDQKKKGNSLFSEVEDRRIEVEKRMISMKVQHESMRKQLEATRQQLHRLKMQLAGVLQMSGRQADSEHIERLERQLVQARGEVDELNAKMHKLENTRGCAVDYEALYTQEAGDGGGAGEEGKHYVSFLKALIDMKTSELGEKEKELNSKSLQLVMERDKLVTCERQLYATQRHLQTTQAQCIKQNVRLEELTAKYEPEKLQAHRKVRQTITEQIPLTPQDGEKTDQSESIAKQAKDARIISNLQKGAKNNKSDDVTKENSNKKVLKSISKENVTVKELPSQESGPLRTVSQNVTMATEPEPEVQPKKKRYELKSVKVKKVSIADEDHVIQETGDAVVTSHDAHDDDVITRGIGRTKKPQHKIVKMSDASKNECQTQ